MKATYSQLLSVALGSDGVVAFVAEPSSEEGEYRPPELPEGWKREPLSTAPLQFLDELRSVADDLSENRVLLLAPWVDWGNLPSELKSGRYSMHLHERALLTLIGLSAPGTRIASLIPSSSLTGERTRPFREQVMRSAHPTLILDSCEAVLSIGLHRQFAVSTIVVEIGSLGPLTRFFRIPRNHDGSQLIDEFERLLCREGGASVNGYVLRRRLEAGSSLSFDLRSPAMGDTKEALAKFGEIRRLGELFEIRFGKPSSPATRDVTGAAVPLVEGRDLGLRGIDTSGASKKVRASREDVIRPGDLLIRNIIGPNTEQLTIVEVPIGIEDAVAGYSVIVLRPKPELDADVLGFIRAFLASPVAMTVLRALLPDRMHISRSALERFQVPLPDEDMLLGIRRLDDARKQLLAWQLETESASDALFDSKRLLDSRPKLISLGQRMDERIRAARQMDDLAFRIRTLFPHPIAHRWREIESTDPSRDAYRGYKGVLETTEILICYLAVLAVVCARQMEAPIPYLTTIASRFRGGMSGGMSFGDWVSVLKEVRNGRLFRDLIEKAPIPELFEVWLDDDSVSAIRWLKRARDDEAHLRGIAAPEVTAAFADAKGYLEWLLQGASFLTSYPARYIETTWWREATHSTHYDFRDLRGDHPLVPVETASSPTHRIERGSLYVVGRDSRLHRLSPLLLREDCPECGRPSSFAFDSYRPQEEGPLYRALEHPHTRSFPETEVELRQLGLLPET
jgi:hypothetical protein